MSLEPLFNAVECHKKGERKKKDAPKNYKRNKFQKVLQTKTRKQVPKTSIAKTRNSQLHLVKLKTISGEGGSKYY